MLNFRSLTRREKGAVAVMAVATALFVLSLLLPWRTRTDLSADLLDAIEMTVTRFLGGAVFLGLIVYLELPILRPRALSPRAALSLLPFFCVAVNNFPFLSVFSGDAFLTWNAPRLLLLIAEYLAVALFEECAFRGVLLTLLLRRFRADSRPHAAFLSLLVSSAVFGLTHLLNLLYGGSLPAVLLQIGYSFLIGGMCGIAFLVTRSLLVPVLLHALYDIAGALVPFLGGGTLWTNPTVILTAAVGVAVFAYAMWWVAKRGEHCAL